MKKLAPYLILSIVGCSEPLPKSQFDLKDYTPKIMHFDLQYDYSKAKEAFDENNLDNLLERHLWQEQTMFDISTSTNNQDYFLSCKTAYEELNTLLNMYNHSLRYDWGKTDAITSQENVVEKRIAECKTFT